MGRHEILKKSAPLPPRQGRPGLSLLLALLLATPAFLGAEEAIESAPALLGGLGVDLHVGFGRAPGISEGIFGDLRYRPSENFGLELALVGRTMVGWDVGASIDALAFFGGRENAWRFAVGPFASVSYGSRILGTNQDDPILLSGVVGPWWSFSGGLVLSPLEFRSAGMEKRYLRLSLGAEYSWLGLAPFAVIEIGCRLWRIS